MLLVVIIISESNFPLEYCVALWFCSMNRMIRRLTMYFWSCIMIEITTLRNSKEIFSLIASITLAVIHWHVPSAQSLENMRKRLKIRIQNIRTVLGLTLFALLLFFLVRTSSVKHTRSRLLFANCLRGWALETTTVDKAQKIFVILGDNLIRAACFSLAILALCSASILTTSTTSDFWVHKLALRDVNRNDTELEGNVLRWCFVVSMLPR